MKPHLRVDLDAPPADPAETLERASALLADAGMKQRATNPAQSAECIALAYVAEYLAFDRDYAAHVIADFRRYVAGEAGGRPSDAPIRRREARHLELTATLGIQYAWPAGDVAFYLVNSLEGLADSKEHSEFKGPVCAVSHAT
jgi:hypothetical protein